MDVSATHHRSIRSENATWVSIVPIAKLEATYKRTKNNSSRKFPVPNDLSLHNGEKNSDGDRWSVILKCDLKLHSGEMNLNDYR